jgi:hypothetical protein
MFAGMDVKLDDKDAVVYRQMGRKDIGLLWDKGVCLRQI